MPAKKQLHIEVFFTPAQIDEIQLKDKNVVVIDVLRASTTIATALHRGAREIIPVSTIESAVKISGSLFGEVTLRGGERNAKMIEGFNLGNSPLEYTEELVRGKSIIFVTTNGSGAIVKGRHSKNLVVGSFVNLSNVVEFLIQLAEDVTIVCAGKGNSFCLEDSACVGRIINTLTDTAGMELLIDDAGQAAAALDKTFGKNILKMLKSSEHGRYLVDIGFGDDLKVCAGLDTVSVLPMLYGNALRLSKEATKRVA